MSDRVTDTFKDSFRDTVIGWFADGASDRAEAMLNAEDCATHGCESGCVGEAIYYSDNARTYERFEDEILDLCNEAGWSDRGEAGDLGTICQIMNDRVWVAVESVARELSEDSFEDYFPDEDSDEDSDDEDSDASEAEGK